MVSAEYGGTGGKPIQGGMIVEEPDIEIGAGVSSKGMQISLSHSQRNLAITIVQRCLNASPPIKAVDVVHNPLTETAQSSQWGETETEDVTDTETETTTDQDPRVAIRTTCLCRSRT